MTILDRGLAQLKMVPDMVDRDAKEFIVSHSDGDARKVLNLVEMIVGAAESSNETKITVAFVEQVLPGIFRLFDKQGDAFYDNISALHKSMRGSDPRCESLLVLSDD